MDSLFAARVASKRELEMAQSEHRAAQADQAAAEAALAMWTTNTSIPAPFAGVVVRHRVDAGATVSPGQPLLDIRSSGAREIETPIPESEIERVRGARAWFQIGDGPWRAARLLRMDGMTDYRTRTRAAYLEPAGQGALEPGAYVRVRFSPGDEPGAARDSDRGARGGAAKASRGDIVPSRGPMSDHDGAAAAVASMLVPDSSVVRRGALAGVFVIREGRAELRWLKLGRVEDGSVEVLAGLRPGEDVALSPAGLSDGQAATAAR